MSKHTIVVGLGFGDEGKGTMTEYFAKTRNADAVIRFNGGQQAGHNIVRADGGHHTFSQFGAATLDGVPSYLSRFCTFNPFTLFEEATHINKLTGTNPYELLSVSRNALLTSPLHVMLNLEREKARGKNNHGTVGQGFGETIWYQMNHPEDAIRGSDLSKPNLLLEKLTRYFDFCVMEGFPLPIVDNELVIMRDALVDAGQLIHLVDDDEITETIANKRIVFEGAQGFLLDENYGFHPHTTWSTTTPKNALTLLEEAGQLGNETVVGAIRSYYTRHGAGPFPTEGMFPQAPHEPYNASDGIQGVWRTGAFDLPLFRYATSNIRLDELAVTFADVLAPVMDGEDIIAPTATERLDRRPQQEELGLKVKSADRVPVEFEKSEDFLDLVRTVAQVDTLHTSVGPRFEDKNVLSPASLLV